MHLALCCAGGLYPDHSGVGGVLHSHPPVAEEPSPVDQARLALLRFPYPLKGLL
jgi:proteasome lid subunit RPN8/RPN11